MPPARQGSGIDLNILMPLSALSGSAGEELNFVTLSLIGYRILDIPYFENHSRVLLF